VRATTDGQGKAGTCERSTRIGRDSLCLDQVVDQARRQDRGGDDEVQHQRDDGKIPRKYRELIAIAVACTTQCPYCLDVHTRNAKAAGATREEVTESALLSAALRAGAATTHGALALKLFDRA